MLNSISNIVVSKVIIKVYYVTNRLHFLVKSLSYFCIYTNEFAYNVFRLAY